MLCERGEEFDVSLDFQSKRALLRSLMNVRPPLKISDEFLKVQDEFLSAETSAKTLTSPNDIGETKGRLKLWQGDITTLKVDAIVNAANSKLLGCFIPQHNCIDNVIHSSAGVQLREECSGIMKMQGHDEPVGSAKITGAYNLPCKHVIHTVGPQIPYGEQPVDSDCEDLRDCYRSCLEIASRYELESIAFCCISTGVFNFPQKLAADIAVKTVEDYLNETETTLTDIIFDVFSDDDYLIYKEYFDG